MRASATDVLTMRPSTFRGKQGEDLAAQYFLRQGYTILGRNLRCRFGEIDLFVQRGNLIVCAEIKTGVNASSEVWSLAQQRRLRRAAVLFLDQYELLDYSCRFDLLVIRKIGETWTLQHLKNVLTFDEF
jgi:putative endonuclease